MLKQVQIDLPANHDDIAALEPGNVVFLNGVVYTAREGVYNRILEEGADLPAGLVETSNANFHC